MKKVPGITLTFCQKNNKKTIKKKKNVYLHELDNKLTTVRDRKSSLVIKKDDFLTCLEVNLSLLNKGTCYRNKNLIYIETQFV